VLDGVGAEEQQQDAAGDFQDAVEALEHQADFKVVSSAGDSGLAGALALVGGVVIGTGSPLGSGNGVGWAGAHVARVVAFLLRPGR